MHLADAPFHRAESSSTLWIRERRRVKGQRVRWEAGGSGVTDSWGVWDSSISLFCRELVTSVASDGEEVFGVLGEVGESAVRQQ